MGVLARVPLDEGAASPAPSIRTRRSPTATTATTHFAGDRRRQVYERNQALLAAMGAEARSLPELALRFCLADDAVSTVIPACAASRHRRSQRGRLGRPAALAGAARHAQGARLGAELTCSPLPARAAGRIKQALFPAAPCAAFFAVLGTVEGFVRVTRPHLGSLRRS